MHSGKKLKNIVVIGGGTGTFTVLSALKKYPMHLTAIVSMADDGGSTGILRDHYGVLPPGDIRRALVALSEADDTMRNLFNYRFGEGALAGHNFGNLFLSALEKIHGNFAGAVSEASRVLNIKGSVLPVTLDNVRLVARLADGTLIRGETNIDIPRKNIRAAVSHVWLEPRAHENPAARDAILNADAIILGPGDLYTSIVPNLLVPGMPEAIKKSPAQKIYICNLMTKRGETDGFTAQDFLKTIERYTGAGVLNTAVFNKTKPAQKILARYQKEGAHFITPPSPRKISARKQPRLIIADLLENSDFVRHDHNRLAQTLDKLILSHYN